MRTKVADADLDGGLRAVGAGGVGTERDDVDVGDGGGRRETSCQGQSCG